MAVIARRFGANESNKKQRQIQGSGQTKKSKKELGAGDSNQQLAIKSTNYRRVRLARGRDAHDTPIPRLCPLVGPPGDPEDPQTSARAKVTP